MPADHDLTRRSAVVLGERDDRRLVEHGALRERAPCLCDDAALGVLAAQLALLQVGVELDLVDRRVTLVSSSSRSRCAGWKFETPIARVRPSLCSSMNARQVST